MVTAAPAGQSAAFIGSCDWSRYGAGKKVRRAAGRVFDGFDPDPGHSWRQVFGLSFGVKKCSSDQRFSVTFLNTCLGIVSCVNALAKHTVLVS